MLHEGAKKVMADYGGSLPRTAKELKELPGIGPYTAGATDRPHFSTRRITPCKDNLSTSTGFVFLPLFLRTISEIYHVFPARAV